MRIARTVIISAVLALSAAGSVAASTAASAAVHPPAAHVQTASGPRPLIHYHT